jgi:hypothetical protein
MIDNQIFDKRSEIRAKIVIILRPNQLFCKSKTDKGVQVEVEVDPLGQLVAELEVDDLFVEGERNGARSAADLKYERSVRVGSDIVPALLVNSNCREHEPMRGTFGPDQILHLQWEFIKVQELH